MELKALGSDTLLVLVDKAEKVVLVGMAEKGTPEAVKGSLEGLLDRAEKVVGIHRKVVGIAE